MRYYKHQILTATTGILLKSHRQKSLAEDCNCVLHILPCFCHQFSQAIPDPCAYHINALPHTHITDFPLEEVSSTIPVVSRSPTFPTRTSVDLTRAGFLVLDCLIVSSDVCSNARVGDQKESGYEAKVKLSLSLPEKSCPFYFIFPQLVMSPTPSLLIIK